jgi:hypothetical protein
MTYPYDYIARIKATKKLAREKNVPVWLIPFANSVGLILLTAVYLGVYTLVVLVDMEKNMDYVPAWWKMLVVHADWIPLIYFAVISLTMLDKVLITIIIIQSAITKSIFKIIQKTDHKIWRKTGKDSYIANKIWWLQQKWVGLDKRIRAMIIIQFPIAFISWRYFF